ncbi:MAG: hydroxypyruvate isomerase [Rhodocyclaceae bacterium]|jgi:hydroxypyruvate isomerase|nr:Hydroxypyruvate isomerase [Rhodocyclaceae bacterium]MBZ0144159.1 hydroxypyruvate isomerase [Rhodocyclaceae bacterium]MCC6880295.1 hydroxypyruvate isomerase [Rhodocyclaceae bacterium]MCL4681517.1 hydroxypyruvate isomerase [Rhodocyclaceae bacterium]
MPKFAANLSMLFTEAPLLERFERATRAGFAAVEVQFPYELPAEQLQQALFRNKLSLVLHNLPAGNLAAGERGIACHPDRVDEFRQGIDTALAYASALGVPQLNCLAGIRPPQLPADTARQVLIDNLRYAALRLKAHGLKLLVEPINTFDIPGFFLSGTRQALALIEAVGADNLFLQYDVYHMQRMEGELAATLAAHLDKIAHIQVADNPGRHEPGTGEINFAFLLNHLDRIGYKGWVGCEYTPAATTEAGLCWMNKS